MWFCWPAVVESRLLEGEVGHLREGEADRTEGSPEPMRDVSEDVPNGADLKTAERYEQGASAVLRVLLAVFLKERATAGRMRDLVVWIPPQSGFARGK